MGSEEGIQQGLGGCTYWNLNLRITIRKFVELERVKNKQRDVEQVR